MRTLKKVAASLSSAFFTPVPHWLDMTPNEMFDWVETANEMQKQREEEQKQRRKKR